MGRLAAGAALLLAGAEPVWKKPVANWSREDARQILVDSPWSKATVGPVFALQGEDARREGGAMGQPRGIGYDGLEEKKDRAALLTSVMGRDTTTYSPPRRELRLLVRWESALPVRAAKLKTGQADAPDLPEHGFAIAVYGIPGTFFGDPVKLGAPLKRAAALKADGKGDVKPASVRVFQLEGGAMVLYLFPFSGEVSEANSVQFTAVIGRIQVSQIFDIREMEYLGSVSL